MSDALPDTRTPLTRDELDLLACDWSDYRKDYGEDPYPKRNKRDHMLFSAGWKTHRDHTNGGQ